MESLRKQQTVADLIEGTDALMVSLGYKPSVMRHFRQTWNALKNHALRRGETILTSELGYALLREHYQIEPFDLNLKSFKQVTRRAVMLLLEYQISGTIAKRQPKYDHSFPTQYAEIGEKFIQYLRDAANLRQGTIRNYHLALERFFSFMVFHGVKSLKDVDIQIINAYIKTLAGYSKSYIASRLRTLSHFFSYAYKEGAVTTEFQWPTVTVYNDRKIPEYYNADEVKLILDAVDRANARGKRDYAMLLLAARYGLRVSDIKALEFSNVDFTNNQINITQQKTAKPLSLFLLPEVGWAIIDYIKNGRPQSDCNNIFIRHVVPYRSFGNNDNLEYLLSKYAREAGVKDETSRKSSFHMLRYSLASDLLRQDFSLTTISGILGHSEINTTSKYTRLDFKQLQVCALEVPV